MNILNKKEGNPLTLIMSLFLLSLASVSGKANSAMLSLATEPLFLQPSVDPNVFFMLDDSGSMDWEITTINYWPACAYDAAHPYSGENECENKIVTGLWQDGTNTSYDLSSTRNEYVYLYNNGSTNNYNWDCNIYSSWAMKIYPDCTSYTKDWRVYSADFNTTFYNPNTSYQPWTGTGLADASFSAAKNSPQPAITAVTAIAETSTVDAVPAQAARAETSGYSTTRNLEGFIYEVWSDSHGYNGSNPQPNVSNRTSSANSEVDMWDEHTRYQVNASEVKVWTITYSLDGNNELIETATAGTSITGSDATEIQQNVANWYQYYRRRSFAARASIGEVVVDPDATNLRFGISVINDYSGFFVEFPPSSVSRYSGYNISLLNDMYSNDNMSSETPLHQGLQVAGEYYKDNLNGKTNPIIENCQANYTVLFTDGYWDLLSFPGSKGNSTDTGGTSPNNDGDPYDNTVADLAHYYYHHDLQSGMANLVPIPNTSPTQVTHQRMGTFTVAFGIIGNLVDTDGDGWPDQKLDGSPFIPAENADWGNPSPIDTPEKIDDMWHVAYNSGANYYAAKNSEEVVEGLQSAIASINAGTKSSAAVATSSGSTSDPEAGIFQAVFEGGSWIGDVIKYGFDNNNELNTTTSAWNSATLLTAKVAGTGYDTNRHILTYNSSYSTGVPFRWPSPYQSTGPTTLNDDQTVALLAGISNYTPSTHDPKEKDYNQMFGQYLVDYLRGQQSYEADQISDCTATNPVTRSTENICTNRTRKYDNGTNNVLGDIIDSAPVYVPGPGLRIADSMGDDDSGGESDYSVFQSTYSNRRNMVYVGSNDGMLHGFDADTGIEKIAYVPTPVFKNLYKLSEPSYSHENFVNGPITVSDAYFNGDWHTVLIGTLGSGGQGIFALDVTNPSDSNFTESNANNIVLWEFTDADDADLGYTLSRPSIARMANGDWVAIFSNGYNNSEADATASLSGFAVLYFVDISDGSLIKKIELSENTKLSYYHPTTPNGAATPAVVDLDGDYVADIIYVGDLLGNMWKIDVTSDRTTNWDVAGASSSAKKPLFQGGITQPITVQPAIGTGPDQDGLMVYFGTGKYLELNDSDPSGKTTQSFYGVWDQVDLSSSNLNSLSSNSLPLTPSDLLTQTITYEVTGNPSGNLEWTFRRLSTTDVDYDSQFGWHMDFEYAGDNNGEVMVVTPVLRDDMLIFITWVPEEFSCAGGGSSWLWTVEAINGTPYDIPPLDLDNNGTHDMADSSYGSGGTSSDDGAWRCAGGADCLTDGLISSPTVVNNLGSGDPCQNQAVVSNSEGKIGSIGSMTCEPWLGRQSWRQLK